jgi:4-hydroxy-3-methylbut-2-enyl diphosphate reductase
MKRLIVFTPLRLEALALGPGRVFRSGEAELVVVRSGIGPANAARAAQRAAGLARGAAGLAIVGLCGGLSPGIAVGDVVVAEAVLDGSGKEVASLPAASLLAAQLQNLGLTARTGTVISSGHLVRGEERAALCRLGADVVDMESAELLSAPWELPLAVVRVVSDTAGEELSSLRGLRGVAKALSVLKAAKPALARWAEALGPREVLLAEPRGFCAGVRRAIETVERALERYGPPVYVRRQIVHNTSVVSKLEQAGAIFVEELSEVPDGARVVFSAHGVGTAVREEAEQRGMFSVDATCPLVSKVHTEARRFAAAGRQVVLVGHAGHDEVEGTLGTVAGISLVSNVEEVAALDLDPGRPTAVVTQTTLATDEVSGVLAALGERFPDLAKPAASDICYASQNRQEAVRQMAGDCDVVLVVGSANSSNSNRLVEVARRNGPPAYLVDTKSDLRLAWLAGAKRVGLTAGASAPEELVSEVLECLGGLGPVSVSERSTGSEHVAFPLPPEVR